MLYFHNHVILLLTATFAERTFKPVTYKETETTQLNPSNRRHVLLIRAFSDFKAFLYILIGGFSVAKAANQNIYIYIYIYIKALKSEKARINVLPAILALQIHKQRHRSHLCLIENI